MRKAGKQAGVKLSLAFYDFIIFSLVAFVFYWWYEGTGILSIRGFLFQYVLAFILVFGIRIMGNIYRQIWRYGGIQCYIRLRGSRALRVCVLWRRPFQAWRYGGKQRVFRSFRLFFSSRNKKANQSSQ